MWYGLGDAVYDVYLVFSGNAIVTARYICVLEGLARMKMQWGDMADSSDVSYVVSLERAEC